MSLARVRAAPEDSLPLRLVVLAAVMVAVVAVVAQGAVEPFTAAGVLALVPAGYAFSYVQRHRSNLATKVLLAVGLVVAFGSFLQGVRFARSVDDARVPLASLFLWVQVLHAFDVPRRRDLAFSMVSSLILMAEAGSLSLDLSFLWFLVPYTALAATWLHLSSRPPPDPLTSVNRTHTGRKRRDRLGGLRTGAATAVAGLVATAGIFVALPRLPGSVVATPPFSLRLGSAVPGFDGGVSNPGLPARSGDAVANFGATAYPGFGNSVDLRARGRLSDRLVMRVRASQPALWRAQAYDVFDGTRWTASDTDTIPTPDTRDGLEVPIPAHQPVDFATGQVVQTFYVESREPNVVFAAYVPERVYFPARELEVDQYGSIRAPGYLDPGLVYSVISRVPHTPPELLRAVSAEPRWSPGVLRQYTQVPPQLPDRVVELARQITDGEPTTYDRVMAVERWLRRNTEYNLDIPPDPPGADPIDHFLFERRQGFCEHIASSMAVLLRAAGVPTRFVVGFGPGERNPLTGYLEVVESDAHAWVEVLYPALGWVPYDPTFGVPPAAPGLGSRFIAPQVLAAAGRFLARVMPAPVKSAARAVAGAVAAGARIVMVALPLALFVIALAASAGVVLVRRRALRRRGPTPTGAAAAFATMCDALASRGLQRAGHQTPSEYLSGVSRDGSLPPQALGDAAAVVRTFELARFSQVEPAKDELDAALAAAERVRRLVRR